MEQDNNKRSVSFSDQIADLDPDEDAVKQEGQEDEEFSDQKLDRHFNKFQLLGSIESNELDQEVESDEIDIGSDDDNDSIANGESCQQPTKPQQNNPTTKQKQRKRRNKNKSARQNKSNHSKVDDDDLFLLADAKNNIQAGSSIDNKQEPSFNNNVSHIQLLNLDMRNLIPENELKRMFGRSVLKEDKSRIRNIPPLGVHRSRFVSSTYLETKPALFKFGLKMELDEVFNGHVDGAQSSTSTKSKTGKEGKNDSKKQQEKRASQTNAISCSNQSIMNNNQPVYFKFVHDKSYQTAQTKFLELATRGHSESIVQNLNFYPTHCESIIQLSDMIRVSEDYKTASELIERALLIFERSFHQKFNISQANCRLSYKRPENRTFFITIFKHIIYTNRRGLRRTPLEYTKLLLSLDPENDPLFATLLIDFYAIRSEEYDYLIEFQSKWQQLSRLPNMNFSLALAYFMKSCNMKRGKAESESNLKVADECLQKALLRYPNFIIPLLDACSAEPDSELKKCDYFDYSVYSNKYKDVPESVDLLVSIYVQRNYMLWKNKSVLAWLEKNIVILVEKFTNGVLEDIGSQKAYWSSFKGPAPRNLLRHIVLSDLKVKIPPSAANTAVLDIDPYPPESIVSYRASPTGPSPSTSQSPRSLSGLFIRSILPRFSLGGEQQGPSQQQQQVPANASDDELVADLAGELERELNDHASRYIDATVNAGEPINLDNIQHSIQNVLGLLTNLLIGAEGRQDNDDAENHNRRGSNNQRQG